MIAHIFDWLKSFVVTYADTVISVLLGGAITWLVSWIYYKKASVELMEEAALQRKASDAMIYMLEHREAKVEVVRTDAGRPTGLIVSATGQAKGNSTAKGSSSE